MACTPNCFPTHGTDTHVKAYAMASRNTRVGAWGRRFTPSSSRKVSGYPQKLPKVDDHTPFPLYLSHLWAKCNDSTCWHDRYDERNAEMEESETIHASWEIWVRLFLPTYTTAMETASYHHRRSDPKHKRHRFGISVEFGWGQVPATTASGPWRVWAGAGKVTPPWPNKSNHRNDLTLGQHVTCLGHSWGAAHSRGWSSEVCFFDLHGIPCGGGAVDARGCT